MTFGERVAVKREERGWSQRELSRISGVSHTQVAELERGLRRSVGTDVAKKLARCLGVSIDWLAGTWEEDDEAVAARRRRPSRVG